MESFAKYYGADPRPVLLVNTRRTILAFNAAARRSLAKITIGSDLAEHAFDRLDVLDDVLRLCAGTRGPVPATFQLFDGTRTPHAWHVDGGLLDPARGSEPAVVILRLRTRNEANAGFIALTDQVGVLHAELRHRRQLQKDLEDALAAKDVLLAEVNHRVKNNLQIITGILRLAGGSADPVFQQTIDRISAMAKVHDLLYGGRSFDRVDCRKLVETLAESLGAVHRRTDVRFDIQCSDLRLLPDAATSVALLVNELISNSFKHAYPPGRGGTIRVRLSSGEDGLAVLTITDDGLGMVTGPRTGSGLKIAQALARKLGGELQITTAPMKAFGVAFQPE
jgi:two-component sensor histidine kinase